MPKSQAGCAEILVVGKVLGPNVLQCHDQRFPNKNGPVSYESSTAAPTEKVGTLEGLICNPARQGVGSPDAVGDSHIGMWSGSVRAYGWNESPGLLCR